MKNDNAAKQPNNNANSTTKQNVIPPNKNGNHKTKSAGTNHISSAVDNVKAKSGAGTANEGTNVSYDEER